MAAALRDVFSETRPDGRRAGPASRRARGHRRPCDSRDTTPMPAPRRRTPWHAPRPRVSARAALAPVPDRRRARPGRRGSPLRPQRSCCRGRRRGPARRASRRHPASRPDPPWRQGRLRRRTSSPTPTRVPTSTGRRADAGAPTPTPATARPTGPRRTRSQRARWARRLARGRCPPDPRGHGPPGRDRAGALARGPKGQVLATLPGAGPPCAPVRPSCSSSAGRAARPEGRAQGDDALTVPGWIVGTPARRRARRAARRTCVSRPSRCSSSREEGTVVATWPGTGEDADRRPDRPLRRRRAGRLTAPQFGGHGGGVVQYVRRVTDTPDPLTPPTPSDPERRRTDEPPADRRRPHRRALLRCRRRPQPDQRDLPRRARAARRTSTTSPPRATPPPSQLRRTALAELAERRARRRRRPRDHRRDDRAPPARRGPVCRGARRDVAQRPRLAPPERPRRLRPHAAGHRGRLARLRDPHGQDPGRARGLPGVAPRRPASAGRSRRAARSRPAPSSRATSPPTTATSPRSSPTPRSATHRSGGEVQGGARRLGAVGLSGIRLLRRLARARAAAARPRGRRVRARALRPRVALLPRRRRRPRGDLPLGSAGGRRACTPR